MLAEISLNKYGIAPRVGENADRMVLAVDVVFGITCSRSCANVLLKQRTHASASVCDLEQRAIYIRV